MSAPRYEINNVSDFLSVPEERIDDCLEEFKVALAEARKIHAMIGPLAAATGGTAATTMYKFTWIDDGKRGEEYTLSINQFPLVKYGKEGNP